VRAELDNGLLHIELERIIPDPEVRTIKIESNSPKIKRNHTQTISVEAE